MSETRHILLIGTAAGQSIAADPILSYTRLLAVMLEGTQYDLVSESVAPIVGAPSMIYINSGSNSYNFTVGGSVPVGTFYKIAVLVNVPPLTLITVAQYTSVMGDTINSVAAALYAYVLANHAAYAQIYGGANIFTLNFPAGSTIMQVLAQAPPSPPSITLTSRQVAFITATGRLRFGVTFPIAANIFVFYKTL